MCKLRSAVATHTRHVSDYLIYIRITLARGRHTSYLRSMANHARYAPIAANIHTTGADKGQAFKYGVCFRGADDVTWLSPTAPRAVAELLRDTKNAMYAHAPAHQRPTAKIVTVLCA